MIERNNTGVLRIALPWGWAIGFYPHINPRRLIHIHRPRTGGWSIAVLWFHFGRKTDRENWR